MRRTRKAKIVATLGPASSSLEVIQQLHLNGADVFRINCSHGSHAEHKQTYQNIRHVEESSGRPIAVLLDLQGPKLRIGAFAEPITLKAGDKFQLDLDNTIGNQHRVYLPHPEIFNAVKTGDRIVLDDGKVRLQVQHCDKGVIDTIAENNSSLSSHKGVSIPDTKLPIAALTEKDKEDLTFGLELEVDWVALSFVQQPADIIELQKLVKGRAAIISKLEKPAAINCLEELIALTDGIMVARGDLGVEMPPEDVPGLQKRIVRACRKAGKPVIIATQMLESMIHAPTPTRAEASDVATAIYDGADAVMLSAESAIGDYPEKAVTMMQRIIEKVENDENYRVIIEATDPVIEKTAEAAISNAASLTAEILDAAAIVTYTTTGSTSLQAAQQRPIAPIIGVTPKLSTARKMALVWGVHSVLSDKMYDFHAMVVSACNKAKREGFATINDQIIITAGVPFGTPGTTNTIRIAIIG